MAFAEARKDARKAAELTQEVLSTKSSITLHTLQAWESGKRPRTLDPVAKITAALGAMPDAMLSITVRSLIES